MTKEFNLPDLFRQFFYQDQTLIDYHFFISRNDGILLYQNSENNLAATAGALTSGVWQAAESLSKLFSLNSQQEFRLSFDSSEQGLYVLKFQFFKQDFYLSVLFHNETNPGLLKAKARQMLVDLEIFLNKQNAARTNNKLLDVRKSYLFSEITDREMDALFSTTGV